MSKRLAPSLAVKTEIPLRSTTPYEGFDAIDGRHSWQERVPEGCVLYPVKRLQRGKILYFNFALAREMGLIPIHHGDEMTPQLHKKLIDTFSLQIINEYDQKRAAKKPRAEVCEFQYMATRYLQLQHADKKGRTSGDGRSIWNGAFTNRGVTWDISSRGTGVTCLAPGAVQAQKDLKTGATEFGYGCGLADLTEILGSAVLSEIFHLNHVGTERVLVAIDLGKGCAIGVRAARCLIRPAHLFLFLKQGKLAELRKATDYLIERQCQNRDWSFSPRSRERYRLMLKEISRSFARFAARLEREYIFAWLDWDGDNVLANAGIIDYGSIRQFGLRHDQYRYDDTERFSTNLNEQRRKARLTVQIFAQLVDFLETGLRKPLHRFSNGQAVRDFDREFADHVRRLFLRQVGLTDIDAERVRKSYPRSTEKFYRAFLALEKTKSKSGTKRLADGINRPAVFRLRTLLREIPTWILSESKNQPKSDSADWHKLRPKDPESLLETMASTFAKKADLKLRPRLRKKMDLLVRCYVRLLKLACGAGQRQLFLQAVCARAEEINREARITGNGAEFVIDELLKARRRGVRPDEIQNAIDLFIASQAPKDSLGGRRTRPATLKSNAGRLFQQLLNIAVEFQDDI